MDALILADGDARRARRELDRRLAGLGRRGRARRRRRRRRPPRRGPRRRASTCGSATAIRSTRRIWRRSRRPGVPIERAGPDKDESDTELADPGRRSGAAPTAIVIVGALGGARIDHAPRQHRAAGASRRSAGRRRRPRRTVADRADPAPGPRRRPGRPALAGRAGDLVSLLPIGAGRRRASRPTGLALPAARRAAAGRAAPAACRTSGRRRGRGRRRGAACCSSSNRLLRSEP